MSIENIDNRDLDEINLKFISNMIQENIKFVAIFTLLSTIISIFVALSIQNIFKSEALLTVSSSSELDKASLSSSYGGIASLAGISLDTGSTDKAYLAMSIIESREFLEHLSKFRDVLPNLIAAESYDPSSKKIIYDESLYDFKNDQWVREVSPPKRIIPSHLEAHRYYSEIVEVTRDRSSGFINISVSHLSPLFAKEFLDLIIRELNFLAREIDRKESEDALEFLNQQLSKTSQLDIKRSINLLIESNLKTMMLSNVREDYLLRMIDRPFVPELKTRPNRPLIVILISFFGFLASLFIVFIRQNYFK